MEWRIEEDTWTQRISPIRRLKPSRNHQKTAVNNKLETIAAADLDERGGCTRFKFVVRKEDLKQVLEAIREGRSSAHRSASAVEERLNLMWRRQILRGAGHGNDRSWKSWHPALQSIPEE